MVRRRHRRRAVGPRRARHEVADRGRGRRRGLARARGLAPGARRPARHRRRRRGGRRRRGRDLAHARTTPSSCAATCSSTRAAAPSSRTTAGASTASASRRRASTSSASRRTAPPGHASNPRLGDNALLKLAPLISAMSDGLPGLRPDRGPDAAASPTSASTRRDPVAALAALRERDPILALVVEPVLGVTFAPTMAAASEKINVIPSRASVNVDCRTPAGHRRGRRARADRRDARRPTATSSSSPSRTSATARRSTRR